MHYQHTYIYMYLYVLYSKTSLNRPTMVSTLNGVLGKWLLRGLEYQYNSIGFTIDWDPNKAIDILEWLNCGGGRLERFYCIQKHCCGKSSWWSASKYHTFPLVPSYKGWQGVKRGLTLHCSAGDEAMNFNPRDLHWQQITPCLSSKITSWHAEMTHYVDDWTLEDNLCWNHRLIV